MEQRDQKKILIYDIADICVACGRPAAPGDMLCGWCREIANGGHPQQKKLVYVIGNAAQKATRNGQKPGKSDGHSGKGKNGH